MSAASVTVFPRRTPPNILVVEGDARIRCLVSDELRTWGFKVLEACSAEEALTVLDAVRIDLLFLALDLPVDGSGWDVAHRVQGKQSAPQMIFTSGGAGEADVGSLGPFIRKPYRTSQVVELAVRSLNWPVPPQA
jgi:DNA-binding response OmpR family regulator